MKKITLKIFILFISFNAFSQNPIGFNATSQASGSAFGYEISANNSDILVSTSTLGSQFGKAYLFNLSPSGMTQTDVFFPSDALGTDSFGRSTSISNEFIAIGSPLNDTNLENSGSVYIYRKVSGIWSFFQKITSNNAVVNGKFGSFVKFYNNQLFISSATNQPGNLNYGAVAIYSFNGSEWQLSQSLATTEVFSFGQKIEFSNNKLFILGKQLPNEYLAKFYVYNFDGTTWTFENSTPIIGSMEDQITNFKVYENQIYVTSYIFQNPKISIYNYISGNWTLSNTLTNNNFPDQKFTSIEISNGNMFVGSSEYILLMERKFPLLHYKKVNNNWIYQNAFYGNEPSSSDDLFGAKLAFAGNNIIIGAQSEGIINSGKAYYLNTLLSNNEFKNEKINIFPNPTSDFIYFKNSNLQGMNSVKVYSITGKLLISKEGNLDKVSLRDLSAGIYLLKINFDNNNSQTLKIIKE